MSATLLDHSDLDAPLAGLLDAAHWYVGFSGGVDSSVLLHLLQRWRKAHADAPALTAIHINHGLQAAAEDWQVHCEWICNLLQVPIICLPARVEPGAAGLEAAARAARYQQFEAQLQPGAVLFMGHHLDDQVETFLLRLMRGAGVQGLAAIPASRSLGQGRLARPLLQVPRASLEHYASHHGLDCVEDPSNRDTSMDRNFLRAQLLPLLASRWPGYRQTVARASEHIAGAAAVLEQALPAPPTRFSVMGDPGIAASELVDIAPEGAAVKLRHWLQRGGVQAPDQALLEEFLRQLRAAAQPASPRLQCSEFTLQRYREAVYLLPAAGPDPRDPWGCDPFSLAPGESYAVPGVGELGLVPAQADGLLLAPGEALQVRWRQGGERCKPLERAHSNSLKKLLQEALVPPWWRDRVPLLYLEDELLAVADLWLCQSSRWREGAGRRQTLWRPRWVRKINGAFD